MEAVFFFYGRVTWWVITAHDRPQHLKCCWLVAYLRVKGKDRGRFWIYMYTHERPDDKPI